MIIHPIKRRIEGDYICLSARIELEKRGQNFPNNNWYKSPETLWYKFPKKYEKILSTNHNGFLAPMVVVAMFFGEDIHVRGEISSKLAYNLKEFQRTLHFWNPNWFSIVSISCEAYLSEVEGKEGKGVMCSYSGGVDSTYTLWSHLSQNESNKNFQVTHALYIQGFDTIDEAETSQNLKKESYTQLLNSLNVDFIWSYSNGRKFHFFNEMWQIYMTFGSLLAGSALFFEDDISIFFFSADQTHDYRHPLFTANHVTTPLLSTEKMNILVYGASIPRIEKISAISKWPETYNRLQVCWKHPNGVQNCGKCSRCVVNMYLLDVEGVLGKYTTFPNKINRKGVRALRYDFEFIVQAQDRMNLAKSRKRWDMYFDFAWVKYMSYIHGTLKSIRQDLIHLLMSLNYFFNPVVVFYRISLRLKQSSPRYERFVVWVKN